MDTSDRIHDRKLLVSVYFGTVIFLLRITNIRCYKSIFDTPDTISSNYVFDPVLIHRLAETEEKIVQNLGAFVKNKEKKEKLNSVESVCLQWIRKYLDEFKEVSVVLDKHYSQQSKPGIVSRNPLLIFKMIRRLWLTLIGDAVIICKEDVSCLKVRDIVKEALSEAGLEPLTARDWEDARFGLLRMHYIYGFDATSELRLGNFAGIDTGFPSNFEDCLAMVRKACQLKAHALAYQWLVAADRALLEERHSVYSRLDILQEEIHKALAHLLNEVQVSTVEELSILLENKSQEKFESLKDFQEYALCRGEMPPGNSKSELTCWYEKKGHPYFYINPLKAQLVSRKPMVIQFFDIIGLQRINFIEEALITNSSYNKAVKSTQTDHRDNYPGHHDFSQNYFSLQTEHPVLVIVRKQIEFLIGLEEGQLSSYWTVEKNSALGGFHDRRNNSIAIEGVSGRSIFVTMDIFTSDSFGGHVLLNNLSGTGDTWVEPVKGSSLVWFKSEETDRGLEKGWMSYIECPVILGHKNVLKMWMSHPDIQ